jgi:hypothetical protein
MAGKRASFPDTAEVAALTAAALEDIARRRGGVDEPGDYVLDPHPWTADVCARLSERIDAQLKTRAGEDARHVLLGPRPPKADERERLMHGPASLYPVSWRMETADGSAMTGLPMIMECVWRGGWRELAAACDRLAIGAARLRVLLIAADPAFDLGGMSVSEAAAFRINAFLDPGQTCLIGFWGGRGSWRDEPGFDLMTYVTGRTALERYAAR